jgi:MFS transporter, DHA1 family, tetracycline resistance protein
MLRLSLSETVLIIHLCLRRDKMKIKVPLNELFPLYLVNFIGVLGFSMVVPFLYILIDKLGGSPIMYGLTGAAYPAFQLLGSPLLGRWSDNIGRKKVLLVSQAGTFISWIALLSTLYLPQTFLISYETTALGKINLTLPLLILLLSRAFDGLTGGNVAVANALLADLSSEKDRNKNYGSLSVSSNLGFVAGPAFAGLLGSTHLEEALPIMTAIIISAVAIPTIIYLLPDPKPEKPRDESAAASLILNRDNESVWKIQGVAGLFMMYFVIFFAFNIFYTAFPVHAVENYQWGAGQLGIFFSFLSLLMVLVQGPLLGYISQKMNEIPLIKLGSFFLLINFLVLIIASPAVSYVSAAFFALGNGLMWPSFLSFLSKKGTAKNQGRIQGIATAFGSFASIIGLIAGGVAYVWLGSWTFFISGIAIFLVIVYFKRPTIF